MSTEKSTAKIGTEPPPDVVRLKAPVIPEHQKWVAEEVMNYTVSIQYLAFFYEARSRLGDMTEGEVWDEIKANVSKAALEGYAVLGEQ